MTTKTIITISIFLIKITFASSLFALDGYNTRFTTINKILLKELINQAPKNADWKDAKNHCWHMLAWIHLRAAHELTFDLNNAENKFSSLALAPPQNFCDFMGEHVSKSFHTPRLMQIDNLTINTLENLVAGNIANNTPILVYYCKNNRIRLGFIVGYNQDKLMFLKVKSNGQREIKTWTLTCAFLRLNMNYFQQRCCFLTRSKWDQDLGLKVIHQMKSFNFITLNNPESVLEEETECLVF